MHCPPEVLRQRLVLVAEHEVGPGRPEVYWQSVKPAGYLGPRPPHWCGIFALWCLHRVDLELETRWKVGAGFLAEGKGPTWHWRLPMTRHPEPGDLAYFEKNDHHAIVKSWSPLSPMVRDGYTLARFLLTTIDGNQPDLRIRTREILLGDRSQVFLSIDPWLPRDTLPPDTEPNP